MKRRFHTLYRENAGTGFQPGDESAHRAAAALADRADAPTIGALTDILTLLERFGGQFHVTALRLENGEEWETEGIGFQYESRDARLKVAAPPAAVAGVPISNMEEPAPEVEAEDEPKVAEAPTAASVENEPEDDEAE